MPECVLGPASIRHRRILMRAAQTGHRARGNSADHLREAFETLDATPDKEITLYCNTGYRSAHAYLALRLLDYRRLRNYVGSWQEWGNRDGLPIWNPP